MMAKQHISARMLADLFGCDIYDEQKGRLPRKSFHYLPVHGEEQGHISYQGCWCGPVFIGEDEEIEVYWHKESH